MIFAQNESAQAVYHLLHGEASLGQNERTFAGRVIRVERGDTVILEEKERTRCTGSLPLTRDWRFPGKALYYRFWISPENFSVKWPRSWGSPGRPLSVLWAGQPWKYTQPPPPAPYGL